MDRLAGCLPDNSLSPGDRKVNLRPQLHPSPPRFLLVVDAGGTRCRARLSDHEGRRLGEGQSGPANAFTDPDGSWASIWAASAAAYSQAGLEPARVAAYTTACLGVAGLAPIEPSAPRTWPLNIFGASIVDTDAFVALKGAHAGKDGAILIIGTGTVGLVTHADRRVSVGGYGEALSDEGGGAWLGRQAVRRMLWSLDGRIQGSGLTKQVNEIVGDPARAQTWAKQAVPADFAAIAPYVLSWAREDDAVAVEIVREGAALLDMIICRLAKEGVDQLSLLGGLSASIAPWLNAETMKFVSPKGDPLDGAILIAMQGPI
jgi:glucosamine kinase